MIEFSVSFIACIINVVEIALCQTMHELASRHKLESSVRRERKTRKLTKSCVQTII